MDHNACLSATSQDCCEDQSVTKITDVKVLGQLYTQMCIVTRIIVQGVQKTHEVNTPGSCRGGGRGVAGCLNWGHCH